MPTMLHGQLHYRCAIDLESLHSNRDDWQDLVKRVRTWIAKVAKVDSMELAKGWFYAGDQWKQGCPKGIRVETSQVAPQLIGDPPSLWACYIENPCHEHHACRWRTDITIRSVAPKCFRLVVINQRWVRPGYVGDEPPQPPASVPSLVSILLKAKTWKCMAGSVHLSATPVTARVGYLNLLKRELEETGRTCPIVYISLDQVSQKSLVNPNDLARCLAGTAVVYVAENTEADQEMQALFPGDFQCCNGTVRLYQPAVQFSDLRDARRHRFFTPRMIGELGESEVGLQIVRACARRAYLFTPEDVTSIDDLKVKERFERLRTLAGERKEPDTELNELIQSVEEDNKKYRREVEDLRGSVELQDLEIADRDDRIRALEHEFQSYKLATQSAHERCAALEGSREALHELRDLPETLSHALQLIGKLHGEKIIVLEDALDSAESASLEAKSLPIAWRCLWGMTTVLHDLYFLPDQPTDLEKAFQDKTGFGLALNEGKSTKKQKSLMNIRKCEYNGAEIEITPHVKWGNENPRCLRVHYHVDRDAGKLVIGHCGDHLENYSSRKRK
jgi:hypothetical protein